MGTEFGKRSLTWNGRGALSRLAVLGVLGLFLSLADANEQEGEVWTSEAGEFRVSYSSELTPLTINRIHRWTLHVETAGGDAVAGADIAVEGGMPAHDHGLPTSPRVTQYEGGGDYLIEGMRFHMRGTWEINLTIDAGDVSDTVVIPLEL